MNCPNCGAVLPEGDKFCKECGKQIPTEPTQNQVEYCPNCGNKISENNKFCVVCGAQIGSQVPPQAQAVTQVQQTIPQPQTFVEAPAKPVVTDVTEPKPVIPPAVNPLPSFGQSNIGRPSNLKEYIDSYADEKTRKGMKRYSIYLYIFAAFNLVLAFVAGYPPIDSIILLVLGIWHQRTYSTACAITALVYSVISVVMNQINTGEFRGWLILIVGVTMFLSNLKTKKDFEAYMNKGGK